MQATEGNITPAYCSQCGSLPVNDHEIESRATVNKSSPFNCISHMCKYSHTGAFEKSNSIFSQYRRLKKIWLIPLYHSYTSFDRTIQRSKDGYCCTEKL